MVASTERFWRRGAMTAWWVTTISDKTAPTAAEIAAGVELTPDLASIEGLGFENQPIDVPDMKSRAQKQIPGPDQLSAGTLTFYDTEASAGSGGLWETLAKGEVGFLVIGPYKVDDPIATDIVEVWPCEVASASRPYGTDAVGATFATKITVKDDPELNATVA